MIIDKTFSRGRGIKLGDVVDIQHPIVLGAGAIKRVMGMPGDFVVKDEGEGKGKRMIQVRCLVSGKLDRGQCGVNGKTMLIGISIGAGWALLAVGGQSTGLEGFEGLWPGTFGADKWKGYSKAVAVVRYRMD